MWKHENNFGQKPLPTSPMIHIDLSESPTWKTQVRVHH